jgi:hypothetical protein
VSLTKQSIWENHHPDEEWPPKRPCTDCNLLIGAKLGSSPAEATFVMTHLSGLQWFACDAHAKNPIDDRGLVRQPGLPIAEFWEQVRASDASQRLKGTWRPE